MGATDGAMAVTLTVAELKELMAQAVAQALSEMSERRYAKGLIGLMGALHCGRSKAEQIKRSGVVDAAIAQETKGGAYVVDVEMCRRLWEEYTRKAKDNEKAKDDE